MDNYSNDDYESDFHSSTKSLRKDIDLKSQLLKVFQEKGIVDKLKSQVRQNLIHEISTKEPIDNFHLSSKRSRENDLIQHTCVSIFAGFLTDLEFSYTLSVFIPEVGISKDKLYSTEEILRILKIDFESDFYKKLIKNLQQNKKCFFWNFLMTISDCHSSKKREIDIQTDKRDKFIPISEKMDKVDSAFEDRQKQGMLKSQQLFEERMASYQRELDKRYKTELENEIIKIRTQELSILKLKEEDNYSRLLKEKTKQMETNYQQRVMALKDREQLSQTNVLKLKESQERENYLQRQQLLRDVNNVQERELELKKDRDRIERELQLMRDKHNLKMETLEAKEAKLRELEMTIELKIQEQVNDNRLSEEKRLIQKWKEVEILEEKMIEERKEIVTEKERLGNMKQELSLKQSLFSELEIIGYPVMKQKCEMLQARIDELEKELQQQISVNSADKNRMEGLMNQLTSPSHETAAITHELERTRSNFQQFKREIENEKDALEKRLVEEVRQKKLLNEQYKEQQDTIEHLSRRLSEYSNLDFRGRNSYTQAIVTGRSTARSRPSNQMNNLERMDNEYGDFPSNLDDGIVPGELTQRIWGLDEETEQINKAYEEFRHRLSNPASKIGLEDYQNDSPIVIDSGPFKQGLEEGHQIDLKWDIQELEHQQSIKPHQQFSAPNYQDTGVINADTSAFATESVLPAPHTLSSYPENQTLTQNQQPYSRQLPTTVIPTQPIFQINQTPTLNTDKVESSNKNNYQPPVSESSSDASSDIRLDQNWRTNQQDSPRKTPIEKQQHQDETSANKNQISNYQPQATTNRDAQEAEDIDPVMKQYMELVKKKKAESEAAAAAGTKPTTSNMPNQTKISSGNIRNDFMMDKSESTDNSGNISANYGDSDKEKQKLTKTNNEDDDDDDDTFW